MDAEIIGILKTAGQPLDVRHLGRMLAIRGFRQPDHILISKLRSLMREGYLEYTAGRWRGSNLGGPAGDPTAKRTFGLASPSLSPVALSLLGIDPVPQEAEELPQGTIPFDKPPISTPEGPWSSFRALLDYYRDCILNDGGAEAMASLTDVHGKFLFISRPGDWLPRSGKPWTISVPLGAHLGPLVQQLALRSQDALLVLGYPLQVVNIVREGEPDSFILKPVFHFVVEHELDHGALVVRAEEPSVQVNLDWLTSNFRESEMQRSFLAACGFIGS